MNTEEIKRLCPEFLEKIQWYIDNDEAMPEEFTVLAEARKKLEWLPISEYDRESLATFCLEVVNASTGHKRWDVFTGVCDDSGQMVTEDGDDLGWSIDDVEFFQYVNLPTPPQDKELR